MLENLYNSLKYAGNFNEFLDLVEVCGATDKLKSFDEFSIFAPNDDVFKNIPKKDLDDIYKDINRAQNILKFHIIPGKIGLSELQNLPAISYEDVTLFVQKRSDGIYLENAKIISQDIGALNGVYYEVNNIINPKGAS